MTAGTVTSAMLGECLVRAKQAAGGKVVIANCGPGGASQQWSVAGRNQLRNKADGKCLTDPGSSLKPGTQVNVTRCVNAKDQTWWLPW